jgi:TIGR03009 family protein
MPRLRKVTSACVATAVAVGSALAMGQDGGEAPVRPQPPVRRAQVAPNAKGAAAPLKAAPDPALMKKLLKDWEGQSAKLKTLQVSIYRIDTVPDWQEEIHYEGRAAFKAPQLAFLDFKKIKLVKDPKDPKGKKLVAEVKNGKRTLAPWEMLVMTGDEVWNYKFDVEQCFIFPLPKDQDKRALEGGPLPFLFNMKAAEAERRYHMTLLAQDDKRYLVRVEPLLQQDKEDFSTALVTLERTFLLPERILLLSPDRKSTRDYRLSHHKANLPVADSFFQGVNPGKGWKVVRNPPPENGPAAKAANAGDRRKPAPR